MSIANKLKPNTSQETNDLHTLTKSEIEILLNMIKTNMFLGEHVEQVYSLVYKLQQQYLSREK